MDDAGNVDEFRYRAERSNPGLRHWDERVNKTERYQLMKIITPAAPGAKFNVQR